VEEPVAPTPKPKAKPKPKPAAEPAPTPVLPDIEVPAQIDSYKAAPDKVLKVLFSTNSHRVFCNASPGLIPDEKAFVNDLKSNRIATLKYKKFEELEPQMERRESQNLCILGWVSEYNKVAEVFHNYSGYTYVFAFPSADAPYRARLLALGYSPADADAEIHMVKVTYYAHLAATQHQMITMLV
jgi:hypothetical protein